MITTDKNTLKHKVNTFIQENQIIHLNKDPTEPFHKHIQQTIQQCDILIDKHTNKHLLQIKPTAPKLNILIKIHKDNKTIRPVINNTQAPSYKAAKHLNRRLNKLIDLPYTYTTKNSNEIAQELNNNHITNHHKMTNLDIKDIYVNLPIQNILNTTKFWLNKTMKPP